MNYNLTIFDFTAQRYTTSSVNSITEAQSFLARNYRKLKCGMAVVHSGNNPTKNVAALYNIDNGCIVAA